MNIVGIGEVLWDMLPSGKALGGAPCNFVYHASQHPQCDGVAVSAVGNDALGLEILESLNTHNIKHIMPVVEYPTGTVQVSLDEKGIPAYEISRDVAWDNIPFTTQLAELARNTGAVCFGSLAQRSPVSRATICRFLAEVPDTALRIFDINLRQNYYDLDTIDASLHLANILKINDDEVAVVRNLMQLPSDYTDEQICRHILTVYGLRMVIETLGKKGSYVFTPDETSWIDTPETQVVDTVGAGDSFTGAFAGALLNGASVKDAHRHAVDTAAFVCSRKGAMPAYPRS